MAQTSRSVPAAKSTMPAARLQDRSTLSAALRVLIVQFMVTPILQGELTQFLIVTQMEFLSRQTEVHPQVPPPLTCIHPRLSARVGCDYGASGCLKFLWYRSGREAKSGLRGPLSRTDPPARETVRHTLKARWTTESGRGARMRSEGPHGYDG